MTEEKPEGKKEITTVTKSLKSSGGFFFIDEKFFLLMHGSIP